MLLSIPFPHLPSPPSWFPGHMNRFTKQLPALLSRTDIVLELRDSQTSVDYGEAERGKVTNSLQPHRGAAVEPQSVSGYGGVTCERIVVLNKRDLVPEWGMEVALRRAMAARFPEQIIHFASCNRREDIKSLNALLVNIAKRNPHATETNVLVVGMPNVGKSTYELAPKFGIVGVRTPKACRRPAQPGHTRALSNRLKLSEDPLVYSYDTPAGIKEGLYDVEALVAYLLYRLNILDPHPYTSKFLPSGTAPTTSVSVLGMLLRGGECDNEWWRKEGGLFSAAAPHPLPSAVPIIGSPGRQPEPGRGSVVRRGWGFDLEWSVEKGDFVPTVAASTLEHRMGECIDQFMERAQEYERQGGTVSQTQVKKQTWEEKLARRAAKSKAKFIARKKGF
ncbi:hypothetical protein EDC04DRAFT_2867449 [Pisolithus marmoratus]|nr:hypothetical protein EDC04DRAFT_2867449 [Pisolithus marmoratus]